MKVARRQTEVAPQMKREQVAHISVVKADKKEKG